MPSILPANGEYDLLKRALEAAGLDAALEVPGADLTVLAPTDAAFLRLAQRLGFAGTDEDAAFGAIVAALTGLGGGDPIPLLTDILLYHVIDGARTRAELQAETTLETLLPGATIAPFGNSLGDGDPDAADARFVPGVRDIAVGSVLIQPVTEVLLPIDVPGNSDNLPPPPTIAGIVAASGSGLDDNGADFDILLSALQATGLTAALADPTADFTVFAPTDDAFLELARTLGYQGETEQGALDAILAALTTLGGGDPLPLLENVLLYHVVDGSLSQAQLKAAGPLVTLAGGSIEVTRTVIFDADPDLRDARFIPGAGDILALNGAVQPIDRVLLPIDLATAEDGLSGTIADELAKSGEGFDTNRRDFDILNAALDATGLTATLGDATQDFTLFAPTDGAFLRLVRQLGFEGRDEAQSFDDLVSVLTTLGGGDPIDLLTRILTYHVAGETLTQREIIRSDRIETLFGQDIIPDGRSLGDLDTNAADPRLIGAWADLPTENGFIQAINGVLLPLDLLG
jgi:uncharacterized surface protein with fasciclin (FAS1) repeats